jgi:Spy/CpxP family protein refolding chaperone
MKKLIVPTLVLSILGFTAFAHAFGPHKSCHGPHHGEMGLFMMEKMLNLTDEQVAAIKEIRSETKNDMKHGMKSKHMEAIFELDPSDPAYQEEVAKLAKKQAAQVEKMIIQKATVVARIHEILTPEQQAKFVSIREEMHGRMKERFQYKESER